MSTGLVRALRRPPLHHSKRVPEHGRGAALKFLETESAHAKDTELRCRIRKNVNLLALEGQPAPEIQGAALGGRPAVLFFWAHWCGDCRAQAPILGRVLSYGMLDGVSVPVDTETMVRRGVSSNPTLALVDRKGRVRLYTPTRSSEEELSRRVEELLAE
ncbi:MAG TPA: thioredoxin domain-containing protein [Thermoanaerobaculia bacterium]